ncbi:MAG TPA: hypothetical protein DDW90_04475 [Cyanobacteria bacterium UBA9971]|nr:hypothetical protein [Cyanobacteria bacterium UBA9971]
MAGEINFGNLQPLNQSNVIRPGQLAGNNIQKLPNGIYVNKQQDVGQLLASGLTNNNGSNQINTGVVNVDGNLWDK